MVDHVYAVNLKINSELECGQITSLLTLNRLDLALVMYVVAGWRKCFLIDVSYCSQLDSVLAYKITRQNGLKKTVEENTTYADFLSAVY